MKTPDEIKNIKEGLKSCSSDECHGDNGDCPYKNNVFCMMTMAGEAMAYIEQLEEHIDLMLIQMRGDCGTCKHKEERGQICYECLEKEQSNKTNWEYEGLPDVKNGRGVRT